MAKRGLGKGLGAIFGDEVVESAAEEQEIRHHRAVEKKEQKKEEEREISGEMTIKLSLIEPNGEHPRKDFNQESL